MKTLILTVSTGQGHNSTASAIHSYLTAAGSECRTLDACYYVNKFLGFTISKGYMLSVDSFSKSYANIYEKLEKRRPSKRISKSAAFNVIASKLREYINDYEPDVVVCTHIFAALAVENLLQKKQICCKTIGVVTDFTIHPYWEDVTNFDYIVFPSERLTWQCRKKGFKYSQMLPFGIPINPKFSTKIDKKTARERLCLYPDVPTITVMSGSMCYGGLTNTVKKLDKLKKCFQIIAVCGSSEEEFNKLAKANFKHKVLKLGYTDKISLIMDASDCILTKPGGLSTSEALAKGLPMILTTPIPGHEERNLTFLLNSGAAMAVSDNCPVEEIVWQFLSDEEIRNDMAEAACKLGKPNAVKTLGDFIINLK